MGVLHKKLLRQIRKSPGQSIAVMMVVLCGTACYVAIASAYRNLELTRDTYYEQYRFADFEIMIERAPETAVFKVEALDGVREARGRIVRDVNVDIEGQDQPRVGRIVSMPERDDPVLNDLVVREGRYFDPGVDEQVILSERFAQANGLAVGDRIDAVVEDKKYSLRIVGLGLSPEYVYLIRNVQELVPSPERFGILWVPEDFAETAFNMRGARNNIVGTVDSADDLDEVLDHAEKLLDPYGVFATTKAEDQISNRFVSDEIKGLGVTARIIPAQFQGIAALILLVLLNRLVRTERTQIGLMKAYGYASWQVALHYIEYALILSIAGCIGGFVVGQWLSYQMIQLYVEFYQFPLLEARVYPDVLTRSVGIALAFAMMGALMAAVRAARLHPAESMRPEAPKYGHRVWVEHWPAIWKRLAFTEKMTIRNVARSGLRAGINVFGVAVSVGILIMGFFTNDSMDFAFDFQFHDLQREDVKVSFQTERGRATWYETMRFDHVRKSEPILEYPFELRSAWREKDVIVIGMPQHAEMQRLMTEDGQPVDVGESGLVLSARLAQEMRVGPGDEVVLKPLMGRIKKERAVPVSKVVRQFLGASAYMNIDALSRILDEPFAMNAALLRTDEGTERDVNAALKDVAGIASVVIREDAYQSILDTIAANSKIMNGMLIIFAGVIALSVIYNVTAVSLAERQRELASLRVMGLQPAEVGRVLYYENFLLAAIGIVAGIPFGMFISWLLVKAYDTDLYRLPFYISSRTYGVTILLSIFFVILANLAVRRRIQKLDLVEVLKERE
jgi:putative ABC transport system permease protein